jgi:hypothetical protein
VAGAEVGADERLQHCVAAVRHEGHVTGVHHVVAGSCSA